MTTTRTLKIIGAMLLVLGLVWQHIQATRLGYGVERARREAQRLRGQIGALQMDLHTSQSPAALASAARTRLGMVPAPPEALRFIDHDAPGADEPTFLARLLWRLSSRSA